MVSLRAENISRNFGSLYAVRNVSLSLREGERRAIIGPNGAGKTTLFNLFTGQLKPSGGRIYMFGQDITAAPVHQRVRLGLSRTFQIMNLIPTLSVLENVRLAIMGVRHVRFGMFRFQESNASFFEEVQSLLTKWGLWDRREDLVGELSYGEQRKMELALALSSKPRILLLDEPTSGLSPAEAASFIAMVRQLKGDITLVVVEHDMDVVFEIADFITVLHYGQVIAEGTKQEIKANLKVSEVYLGEAGQGNA
jgi:branched-chain amino acid transport system ATP-binding protein